MNYKALSHPNSYENFITRAARAIQAADESQTFAVLYMDITDFQIINDFYGFHEGDRMLQAIRQFLQKAPGVCVHLRVFADHFLCLVMLPPLADIPDFLSCWERVLMDFLSEQRAYHINCRPDIACGFSQLTNGVTGLTAAIDNANMARKESKRRQKTCITWFNSEMKNTVRHSREMEIKILSALSLESFTFYLQPKVDLNTGKITGAEALARWPQPDGAVIQPSEFIPIMERNGTIIDLDLLIYKQVCHYLRRRLKNNEKCLPISVNLSRLHVKQPRVAERLHAMAEAYHIPPGLLEFEITETVLTYNFREVKHTMETLLSYGYKTSIDDYGSGFTGINVFRFLPFQVLKLDKSFLLQDGEDQQLNALIISSVVDVASSLQTQVVCEGTETLEQCSYMKHLGCTAAQGFYFSKPLAPHDFDRLLIESRGFFKLPWTHSSAPKTTWKYSSSRELTLNQKHAINSSLADMMPCGIAGFHDETGDLLFLSDKTLCMFGYSREEFEQDSNTDWRWRLFPEAEGAEYEEAYQHLKQHGSLHFDYSIPDKNRHPMFVSLYCARTEMPALGPYILCCFFDSTEQEKNRAVVHMLEDTVFEEQKDSVRGSLQAVLEHLPGDVLILRIRQNSFHIHYLTYGLLPAYGYTEKEFKRLLAEDNGLNLIFPQDKDVLFRELLDSAHRKKPHMSINYRAICADGHSIWCNLTADFFSCDEDGTMVYHGIITSIDRLKHQEDELRRYDMRYRIAADMLNTDIWSYDYQTDMLDMPVTEETSGIDLKGAQRLRRQDFIDGFIHPDYVQQYLSLFEQPEAEAELLVRAGIQGYQWFHVISRITTWDNGQPLELVGISRDISASKTHQKRYQALQKKVSQDPLTGLYNRNYIQRVIQNSLSKLDTSKTGAAFIMLDVDDFKTINDRFGHNAGDRVLKDIARALQAAMPPDGMLGRTGGDEFIAFLSHIQYESDVHRIAQTICDFISDIKLRAEDDRPVPVTVSIGIAFARRSIHFEKIYEQADSAMYISKQNGKNCYTIYQNGE